MKIKLLK